MTMFYLIRHGEIPQVEPRRFIGSRELPLTDKGRAQIARVAEFLNDKQIGRLVCSPLGRCRESAAIISKRLCVTVEVVSALAEIHLGAWEGLTVAEVRNQFPGQYEARGADIAHYRPEGGESFQDLLDRTWPPFAELASAGDDRVAVVAHSGVIRVLLCRILGMPLEKLLLLEQGYGCCHILARNGVEFRVRHLNHCP